MELAPRQWIPALPRRNGIFRSGGTRDVRLRSSPSLDRSFVRQFLRTRTPDRTDIFNRREPSSITRNLYQSTLRDANERYTPLSDFYDVSRWLFGALFSSQLGAFCNVNGDRMRYLDLNPSFIFADALLQSNIRFLARGASAAEKNIANAQATLTAVHLADKEQVGSFRISLEEFAHISPLCVIDYRLRRRHCKQERNKDAWALRAFFDHQKLR